MVTSTDKQNFNLHIFCSGINIIEGPPDTVPHILDPESPPPPSPSSWMLPLSRGRTNCSNPKRKIEELTLKKLELEVQYLELKIKKLKKEEWKKLCPFNPLVKQKLIYINNEVKCQSKCKVKLKRNSIYDKF